MLLPDGTCIPAHMNVRSSNDAMLTAFRQFQGNDTLRVGYLTAIHVPGDEGYATATQVTYDALVYHANSSDGGCYVPYQNCAVAMSLGSATDWEQKRLRCPKSYTGGLTPEFLKSTTKVLLLCVDGRTTNGVIVAATRADDAPEPTADEGHNWQWYFNGIHWNINKEGEFQVTRYGKTVDDLNKDVQPDPEAAGTYLKIDKDGNIILDDVAGDYIVIDKKNKQILIQTGSKTEATAGDWTVVSNGNAIIAAGQDVMLAAEHNTYIGSTATEPLVLGHKLVTAFSELISILTSSPAIGALGQAPVTINPILATALKQWQAKYGVPAAPILSKSKFTE